MKFKCYNIDWDAPSSVKNELPDEMVVDVDTTPYYEDAKEIKISDEDLDKFIEESAEYDLSDIISDETGYCHFGFESERISD